MKKIVIIGASSGIGQRIATDMASKGWRVGIAARREEPLKAIKEQFPANVAYSTIDVTSPDAAKRFLNLIELIDGMDVLLYCSGVGKMNPELDEAVDVNTVEVNCAGMVRIVDAAYNYFKATANVDRGRIAVISSIAGTRGIGIAASYSASKRFQRTYLDALNQLAHQEHVNVGFTDIRPGFIDTPLLNGETKFPMTMSLDQAAPLIEKAITRGRRVATIDSRWRIVDTLWRLIPGWAWRRIGLNPQQSTKTHKL